MNDNNLFSLVLDKDEEILKTYRPNKMRAWFTVCLTSIVLALFLLPVIIGSAFDSESNGLAVGVVFLSFFVVYILISFVLIKLWINKTVYAVTNKRILIRTGYIGVDYKSLDYTMLGAFTVNVSWVDKLIHKNTGSLAFGSVASPMTNGYGAKFNFSFISSPYETYKEIKAIIDQHKN